VKRSPQALICHGINAAGAVAHVGFLLAFAYVPFVSGDDVGLAVVATLWALVPYALGAVLAEACDSPQLAPGAFVALGLGCVALPLLVDCWAYGVLAQEAALGAQANGQSYNCGPPVVLAVLLCLALLSLVQVFLLGTFCLAFFLDRLIGASRRTKGAPGR